MKWLKIIPLWIALATCLSSFAYAENWSLSQIEKRALELAPTIRIQAKEVQAEKLRARTAGLLPNPYAFLQTGTTVQNGGSRGAVWDITLSQMFPFPGKLSSQSKAQDLVAQVAEVNESELKLVIQHEVNIAAVRVAMLNEISHHTQERRKRFRLIQDYLRTHPMVSPSQKIESTLIENQIHLLGKGIYELNATLHKARMDLGFFLQSSEKIDPQVKWLTSVKLPDKDQLYSQLKKKNFELHRAQLEVDRAQTLLKRAKLDPWPDFFVGLNYRIENVVPSNQFYQVNLGVTLPFWDRGQFTIPSMEARLDAETYRSQLAWLKVEKEFNQIWEQVMTSAQVLKEFPLELIQASEKNFLQAEKEFKKTRINAATFLQTDAQIHETMDAIYQAQVYFLEQLSALYRLVGMPLKWEST